MVILEFKYLMYIHELKKKNLFIWMFRRMYKKRLRKRYELLKKQKAKGLVGKKAFEIWSEMLLKVI